MTLSVYKKIFFSLSLVIAICLGYFSYNLFNNSQNSTCDNNKISFINPKIDCLDSDSITSSLSSGENKVRDYVDSSIKLNKANRISVFYRDLNSTKWSK